MSTMINDHPNKTWTRSEEDPNRATYVCEISELNYHPSAKLRDPWNRIIDPGDLSVDKMNGEIVSWRMTCPHPCGGEAQLLIVND